MNNLPIVLGMTGASGALYAVRLLQVLLSSGRDVHLSISPSAQIVLRQELDVEIDLHRLEPAHLLDVVSERWEQDIGEPRGKLHYHHFQDFMAPIASGSFRTAGMVVCPCSGSTLSSIAHASGANLIQRAAEVQLKERRKLVLVPRETPLSRPQLENMLKVTDAGAVVLPAMPGFYHEPARIEDLIDFVVGRICDQLGVENSLMQRWGTQQGT